jgi:hypothetical protein
MTSHSLADQLRKGDQLDIQFQHPFSSQTTLHGLLRRSPKFFFQQTWNKSTFVARLDLNTFLDTFRLIQYISKYIAKAVEIKKKNKMSSNMEHIRGSRKQHDSRWHHGMLLRF